MPKRTPEVPVIRKEVHKPVHKREISSGSNGQHVGVLYMRGVLTEYYGDTLCRIIGNNT